MKITPTTAAWLTTAVWLATITRAVASNQQLAASCAADSKCIVSHCSNQSAGCFTDNICVLGTLCANKCMKLWEADPNSMQLPAQNCSNACLTSYADATYQAYMNCMTSNNCLTCPPIQDKCPTPKPNSTLSMSDLEGDWWAYAGLHPLYDCYPCDVWHVTRGPNGGWMAGIAYTSNAINGTAVTEVVHWPVPDTKAGEAISGSCQGCFVKGMPHSESWYLLDTADDASWISFNYCGSTMNWDYHGALVLIRAGSLGITPQDQARINNGFQTSVNATFPKDFCLPTWGNSTCPDPFTSVAH